MAYAHVGHDCVLGDQVTLSNMVSLAGHVTVDDGATCSGYSAIHQFVRIGRLAFIAANAMVVKMYRLSAWLPVIGLVLLD